MPPFWTTLPSAPDPGAPVAPLAELPMGVRALTLSGPRGDFPLLVVRDAHGVRGFLNLCPHQALRLDRQGGDLLQGGRLICSVHGAAFDSRTGAGIAGLGLGRALAPVPLETHGETVRISR